MRRLGSVLCGVVALLGLVAGCATSEAPGRPEVRADAFALTIPKLGVAGVVLAPVGLRPDRTVDVPPVEHPEQAAVYTGGPMPGSPGPALIVGHVNGGGRPGVFARLGDLAEGDRVSVAGPEGPAEFVVYRAERVAKADFPTAAVFSDTQGPELRLVTCGGSLDRSARSYVDNVIVYARRV